MGGTGGRWARLHAARETRNPNQEGTPKSPPERSFGTGLGPFSPNFAQGAFLASFQFVFASGDHPAPSFSMGIPGGQAY